METKHQRVLCSNPDCRGVFAHSLDGGKTLDIARGKMKHRFTIVGGTYSIIGTCTFCETRTSLSVNNGVLETEDLRLRDMKEGEHGERPEADPDSTPAPEAGGAGLSEDGGTGEASPSGSGEAGGSNGEAEEVAVPSGEGSTPKLGEGDKDRSYTVKRTSGSVARENKS